MSGSRIGADIFKKSLTELEVDDLVILREVPEGWYVDYKEQLIEQSKLAKHLSAFANQYGGWLIFGVKECDPTSKADGRFAGEFPGLNPQDVATLIERVRNAARDQVNPTPIYQIKSLIGPCEQLGLAENRSIVVIEIPQGDFPPYVESKGRIYRRVSDSSDPVPENDRNAIDHLFQRARQSENRLNDFFRKPAWFDPEIRNPYIRLFFMHDPSLTPKAKSTIKFHEFKQFMTTEPEWGDTLYDNFSATSWGYVARHVGRNSRDLALFQFQYNSNLSATACIPLNCCESTQANENPYFMNYTNLSEFLPELPKNPYYPHYIVDCNIVFASILGAIKKFKSLLARENVDNNFHLKIITNNTLRTIPFLNFSSYVKFIQQNGLPIGLEEESSFPKGTGLSSLFYCPDDIIVEALAYEVFALITSVMGIPFDFWWEDHINQERLNELMTAMRLNDRK